MSTKVCTYFLQNACIHGADCRFLHRNDSSPSPNVAYSSLSSTSPCPHHLRGACRYGDHCRRPHSTGNSSGTTLVEGNWGNAGNKPDSAENAVDDPWNVSDPWGVKDPWSNVQTDWNRGPEDFSQQRQKPEMASSTKPHNLYRTVPCKYFPLGKCMRGDSCNFQHLASSQNGFSRLPHDMWKSSKSHGPRSNHDRSSFDFGPTIGPSREPCQFFIRGQCPRGNDCPFIHEGPELASTPADDGTPLSSLCQLYLIGKCPRGSACPFLHNDIAEEALDDTKAPTDSCRFNIAGKCTRGSACPFLHAPADTEPHLPADRGTAEPCQFFSKGNCPRGNDCPFPHVLTNPAIRPSSTEAPISQDPWSDDPSRLAKSYQDHAGNRKLCKYFSQGCFRGSACRYSHGSASGDIEPYSDRHSVRKSCKFFALGNCRNGDNCMYSHAVTDRENAQDQSPINTWGDQQEQVQGQPTDTATDDQPLETPYGGDEKAIQSYDAPNASDGGARVSGPICKSFLQGRCRYGDSCWYQHSSAEVRAEKNGTNEFWSPRATKPTNKSICSFFANGHCKKGTACSFLHSPNDDRGEAGNSHSWTIPTEPWVPQEETQEGDKPLEPWNSWGYDEEPRNDWFSNHSQKAVSEKGDNSEDVKTEQLKSDLSPHPKHDSDESGEENDDGDNPLVLMESRVEPKTDTELVVENGDDPLLLMESRVEPKTDIELVVENVVDGHGDMELTAQAAENSNPSTPHLDTGIPGSTADQDKETESRALPSDGSVEAEIKSDEEVAEVTHPDMHTETVVTIERYILNSTVAIGPGAAIQNVVTAFESPLLILSNLPRDVKAVELKEIAELSGEVIRVLLERSVTLPTAALVEFTKCADAALAARTLDKIVYRSTIISATLELRSGSRREKAAAMPSRTAKISWPAPSLTGWAHYASISTAKEQAKLLQGLTVGGRKIAVSYVSPRKKQTHSFTVELKNLPSTTTRDDLKAVCPQTTSISIAVQTNYDRGESIGEVRRLLTPYEPINALYVLPPDASRFKIIAFADFQSPEIVSAMLNNLHRAKQECLKNNTLSIEPVYTMTHDLAPSQFTLLKEDLDHLSDANDDCKIRLLSKDENGQPVNLVRVHIDGTDPTAVGHARKALESLLCGEPLLLDEDVPWDDHFDTQDGRTFFTTLNTDTRFFVQHSRRTRTLRYFGRQLSVNDARELVLRQLRLARAHRHNIPAGRDVIQPLLSGSLKRLRDDNGISATLNIVSRILTVHSDNPADIKKVKRVLADLASFSSASSVSGGTTLEPLCSVCTCRTREPVDLPCGHVYCRICLRHILRHSISAHATPPLMCMVDRDDSHFETSLPCYTEFPLKVIQEFLSEREETRLFEHCLLSFVRQHPQEFRFCPTPDCPIFYRPDKPDNVLQCPSCQKRICPSCCVQYHEGLSCSQYQEA